MGEGNMKDVLMPIIKEVLPSINNAIKENGTKVVCGIMFFGANIFGLKILLNDNSSAGVMKVDENI